MKLYALRRILFLLLTVFLITSCLSLKNESLENTKKELIFPPIQKEISPQIDQQKKDIFVTFDIDQDTPFTYSQDKKVINSDILNPKEDSQQKQQNKNKIVKNTNTLRKTDSRTTQNKKNFVKQNQENQNISLEEEYKKYLNQIKSKYSDKKDSINTNNSPNKTNIKEYSNSKNNIKQKITKNIDDKNIDMTNFESSKLKELPLSQITIIEGKKLNISIKGSGWIFKKMGPHLLELENRTNYKENTVFTFNATTPGESKLIFIKYNDAQKEFIRKPYLITIKPYNIINIKKDEQSGNTKKQTNEKSSNVSNNKSNEKSDFRMDLANSLFKQKKYSEAKNRYLSILQENNDTPEIYYKLGYIEKAQNNDQKALEYFKKNIESADNVYYYDSLYEIIRILKDEKKYSQAIDTFFKYATTEDLEKSDAEKLFILLADVYFYKQDFVSAANEYRKFYENFPNSKYLDKALFFLAYSLENLDNNPDYKEAYRLYKIIKNKYPESKYYFPSIKKMLFLERHYLKIF